MPSTSSTAQQRPQHSQQQQQQHTTPLSLLTQKNTPKVLLFGCQSLTFTALHFRLLRQTLHAHPENHWALDVLSELPVYIRYAGTYLPSIRESLPNVEEQLRELRRWVLSTDVEVKEEWFPLPYVLHAPMFMVGHLVQFAEFVRLQNEDKHGDSGGELMEVVGFCIGFLSAAVAAASGGSLDRLKVYGAVGVRLAMLLGVMGDAMERGRRFTSVTVLHDAEMEVEMERVIGGFPETYITVRYDTNRSTVMTPRSSLSPLLQALRSAGFSASHINFNGRYHWSGHNATLDALYALCDAHPTLQLPDASQLHHQTWTNITGSPIRQGPLHRLVLQSVLSQPCMWYQTFSSIYHAHLQHTNALVIEFGHERCIPPSYHRHLHNRIIHFSDLQLDIYPRMISPERTYDDDIAIIGTALRVAGADDLDEFWKLLCSGKSQHRVLPAERYKDYETPWRPDATTKPWIGNFLRDIDAFDHRFFKKVPREVMAQDPQQRLLLQVAYQAVEQSGYFSHAHNNKHEKTKEIGCYVSCCTVDYEHNVNCHPASAYAATGLLRSFIAGKLSHYFGWRGPALCIDTACSGSTVVLHHACRAILNGDCKAALVGGANCITSPLGFDNLNGASFLSPTGPCRPFDAKADGYCRGEGVAAMFIKRMRDALRDGDHVLGVIAGTAVEQNDNCTPVVVPHAGSLAELFRKVTKRARVHPRFVSVVEAHGTGTQAGDPAEYASVREVMGGDGRRGKLSLGSVKGLVGHTEGVSGMVALVKVLLMIHEGRIPPQPGFERLNPNIQADEMIEIPTGLKDWEAEYRVALINNYGACGSNASVVVTQVPVSGGQDGAVHGRGLSLPFRICGLDEHRVRDNARRLRQFLQGKALSSRHASSLANLSFSACRQSNPTLDCQVHFSCSSIQDLDVKLSAIANGQDTQFIRPKKQVSPVVLCFGGQVSTSIGLDRSVYDTMRVFRDHLDKCDRLLKKSGYSSLYPDIFQGIPITDHIKLQTQLFSLQYACARSWIDSGVPVSVVIGHSFGELTAMCVSGVISLEDALTLIARRARLIRDNWGKDPGGMIAVEGDRAEIDGLLAESAKATPTDVDPAGIACFNGPRSFTLAGPMVAIDVVQQSLTTHHTFSRLRWKRLDVTNAFHSTLVEPLMSELREITQDLALSEPIIRLERATEKPVTGLPSKSIVADHLRQPVYFSHAVQRLAAQYPACIWLEAGSGSTITLMVNRALEASSPKHIFQGVNITGQNGVRDLTDATIALWKEGIHTTYWAHHSTQTPDYGIILLPPYQFEKSRHWMENKPLPVVNHQTNTTSSDQKLEFLGYQDRNQLMAKFRVNTAHSKYREALSGHVGAQTAPLAPASHMLDNVVEALRSLPEGKGKIPQVRNVTSDAPLGLDGRDVYILLHAQNKEKTIWDVKYISEDSQKGPRSQVEHCVAQIKMFDPDEAELSAEFARYSRLISHRRCQDLLSDPNVDDVLQGRNIYRYFSEIVEYSADYRGVTKLVGKGNESAGRVVKKYSAETWADTFLCDSFSQIGGFWVNCMTDRSTSDIYIASGMEQWMRTPMYADPETPRPEIWDVLAAHERSDGFYTSDIFVFDPKSGRLVELFIGMKYSRVPKAMFCKVLSKLNSADYQAKSITPETTLAVDDKCQAPSADRKPRDKESDLAARIKSVVAGFCAVDPSEIRDNKNISDAGVDSLMAMEMARELEEAFNCTLSAADLMEAETFRELVCAVQKAMGLDANEQESDSSTRSDNGGQDTDSIVAPSESCTSASADTPELTLTEDLVLKAFGDTKALTDQVLSENHCSGRVHSFNPLQMQLCVTLTLEAFEALGSYIRIAQPGERLDRISHDPQHQELVDYLYRRLEEARLVDMKGTVAIRTGIEWTDKSSAAILEEINRTYPEFARASKLAFYTGSKLASVLRGEQDGLQLIFGTKEGQELVSWMYGDESHNVTGYKQMLDFIQRLASSLDVKSGAPLRILEMGAGTGGGTKWLLPGLAKLEIAVEYTFSDISPAFLAQARRRFRDYSFVKYRVHDIEKAPADALVGSQHIIIASNAVHVTSNLQVSTRHMREALRPDGVVMMLEMTRPQFAIDIVFGLFRGWWVFNDGRTHAITSELRWETDLHAVGYGHVDWTDGYSPEVSVQRVLFATCTGQQRARLPLGPKPASVDVLAGVDSAARRRATDGYILRAIEGFAVPVPGPETISEPVGVLVTGATGSLGSHLVAHLARLKEVERVICINRRGKGEPLQRQKQAMAERGVALTADELDKLTVYVVEGGGPLLGLSDEQYDTLKRSVTHIIHNAWPMNGAISLSAFESQFRMMRSLVDLACDISADRSADDRIGFQFVSSIGTVGHRPLLTSEATVLEDHGTIDWALTNGYAEAKFVCEQILHRTLCQHPHRFNAMVVRPGQISGSSTTGYWNAAEHFPALLKSAQTLKVLPSLDGLLSWTPVDVVAATLSDLLFTENPHSVYHVDNAARQPWSEMIGFLAEELNIPPDNIIPFPEWIQRVKAFTGNREDNPASVMADWLADNFERMSCGGLLLDTSRARQRSPSLQAFGRVGAEVVRRYIQNWRQSGFLH
ncbi:type I Iterative Polyketide synthase (PKS) [Aspergillus brasiliensis]|uniref:Type I Iterative Polyketide synthase (PKS) n=1 Tax=Aspergillus brasiliensis TaxID=319629 RepID=A0A9W5YY86_9EURO|nr:type I Iterative Polyketide synthase (PKS) [Aspergillus brasiliensis]GKZ50754.1 type I Iterative Polyketide synthase (PKS) [Aspergillus brasiliensis]